MRRQLRTMPGRLERWIPVALLLIVGWRVFVVLGEFPPGLDEANMLLVGRRLLGMPDLTSPGPRGDALVPLLLALLDRAIGPVLAARTVALASHLAVAMAHYVLARRGLPPLGAASVAALAAACRSSSEPTLGGGYQQNVAFAALILVVGPAVEYLESGARRWAVGVSFGLVVVALSHWAFTPIALVTVGACALLVRRGVPWTRLGLALAAIPALLVWIASSLRLVRAGYDLVLHDWTRGLAGIWDYVFTGPLWSLAGAAGLLALLFHPRLSASTLRVPSLAMLLAGLAAALAVPHPRVMPPVVAAALLGLGLLAKDVLDRQPTAARRAAAAALVTGLSVALLLRADRDAAGIREWYRVLDRDLVELAARVRAQSPPVARAAVNAVTPGTGQGGLWLAILTEAPTIVGADPASLAFPEERARARLAASFFEPHRSWLEASAFARGKGVSVLVSAKGALPQWRDWVDAAGPDALEAGRFVAFRVRGHAPPR